MKKILMLLIISFTFSCSNSQVKQERKMHRIQDTTLSQSGWYYGKSTDGHFSIELPIPFNDATIKTDGIYTYVIGSTSQEGFKFSVTEMKNRIKSQEINFDELILELAQPNNKISNISKSQNQISKSIYCESRNDKNGAFMKYIYHKKRLYTLIIEYPIDKEKLVAEFKDYYFSSFTIIKN